MNVPIACSLDHEAAHDQLGEWQRLLATAATAIERVSPTEMSIRLVEDPTVLASAVLLAQREKACCPFLDFALHIEPDTVALHVRVPDEAAQILDAFAAMNVTGVSD